MSNKEQHTQLIKDEAIKLGFASCGIAKAEFLDDDASRLEAWLNKEYNGKMQYMERYFDLRTDPRKLVEGARSVITLTMNYYPEKEQREGVPKIAKYAWGKDYHYVIKDKLKTLLAFIKDNIGDVQGRGFVDSAPVLEKAWAQKAGLGWVGKNANLLTKHSGSFFFIATIISDLDLVYDNPFPTDHCGTCTKCIDACPTDAIVNPTEIDGSKCISYFTIELKDALIPNEYHNKMNDWMFGCDICQDVCPWNRFSKPHQEPEFEPIQEILDLSLEEWEAMTEDSFKKLFGKSPLKRTKWAGIQRNLKAIKA